MAEQKKRRRRRTTNYGPRKQPRYITEQDLTVTKAMMDGSPAVRVHDEVHGITYIVDVDATPESDDLLAGERIRRLVIIPDEGVPVPRSAPLTLLGTAAIRLLRGMPVAGDRPITRYGTLATGRGRPSNCPPPQVLAAHVEDGIDKDDIAAMYGVARKTAQNWIYTARKNYSWFPTVGQARIARNRRLKEHVA